MAKRTLDEIFHSLGIDQLAKTPHGYRGCCAINPDHIDHSPSMHIHLEKGLVKCFSCGEFRPLFSFLTDKGVPFDEAIDFLFNDFEQTKDRVKEQGMKEWLLGRKVPLSMLKRGFTIPTLKHFQIGYDEVEKRITIPLRYKGTLYGINYRIDKNGRKRIWSSGGFSKDNYIYNFEDTEERVYVEGQTDTWKVWQNGTPNVSATLMAYPTDNQLALMKKHKTIYLAYDNDEAGWKGAFRINKEIGREVEIKVVPYSGKDPGECSKKVWENALKNAVNFVEFEVQMIKRMPELHEKINKSLNGKSGTY